jgi:hypothetical protein
MALTYKFFLGYRVMDYFAVEGGYIKFDTPEETYCFTEPTTGAGDASRFNPPNSSSIVGDTSWRVSLPLTGWTAYAVGLYPFAEDKFEAFIKGGAIRWSIDGTASENIVGSTIPSFPPNVPEPSQPAFYNDSGWDIAGGLGMNFNSETGVTVRAEYEYFNVQPLDSAWLLSLSAIYNF